MRDLKSRRGWFCRVSSLPTANPRGCSPGCPGEVNTARSNGTSSQLPKRGNQSPPLRQTLFTDPEKTEITTTLISQMGPGLVGSVWGGPARSPRSARTPAATGGKAASRERADGAQQLPVRRGRSRHGGTATFPTPRCPGGATPPLPGSHPRPRALPRCPRARSRRAKPQTRPAPRVPRFLLARSRRPPRPGLPAGRRRSPCGSAGSGSPRSALSAAPCRPAAPSRLAVSP